MKKRLWICATLLFVSMYATCQVATVAVDDPPGPMSTPTVAVDDPPAPMGTPVVAVDDPPGPMGVPVLG